MSTVACAARVGGPQTRLDRAGSGGPRRADAGPRQCRRSCVVGRASCVGPFPRIGSQRASAVSALRRCIRNDSRPEWVGSGRPSQQREGRRPVIDGQPCVEPIRASSVRGELGAQDRRNVLTLTQQPDYIQMVAALEVAPQQRELCDLSRPSWCRAAWQRRAVQARRRSRSPRDGRRCPRAALWDEGATTASGICRPCLSRNLLRQ